jgi:DNA replication protein DnaC
MPSSEAPEACPVCQGKGWLTYDVSPSHAQFGKLARCPRCNEADARATLQSACGLPEEWLEWTFANTVRHEGNAAAYDAALRLALNPQRFLTLAGSYGLGKSRLLACIVNERRRQMLPALYARTVDLLDALRRAYDPQAGEGYDALLDRFETVGVLCLDEFDRFNTTEWAREKLFQIVDARYQRGRNLLTCFATNAAVDDLPPYLQSRLLDSQCCVCEVAGRDIRRRQR